MEGLREDWEVIVDHLGLIVGSQPRQRHPDGIAVEQFDEHLVMPAFVNAHSHAFQRAFRGHVQWSSDPHDDFWSWRQAMYAVANALDPDAIEAISELAFLEMAEAGIGAVGEFHYVQHQPGGQRYADPDEMARRVIAAARRVGIRICLLRVAYGRSAPGEALQPGQLRFGDRSAADVCAAVRRLREGCDEATTIGVAPHSTPRSHRSGSQSWRVSGESCMRTSPSRCATTRAPSKRSADLPPSCLRTAGF